MWKVSGAKVCVGRAEEQAGPARAYRALALPFRLVCREHRKGQGKFAQDKPMPSNAYY